MIDQVRELQKRLIGFEKSLGKLSTGTVTRAPLLRSARDLVDFYFRSTRPALIAGGTAENELIAVDAQMQALLEATHKRTATTVYRHSTHVLYASAVSLEKSALMGSPRTGGTAQMDPVDRQIVATLAQLVPSAGAAYAQALSDLAAAVRLSWRGPATDLREALRETLDHLAPDADVAKQPGFKIERDTTGPTMKQKTRYVLRQRGKGKAIVESTEAAVESVDGIVGGFVRSVYQRSSVSTHTPTDRDEVLRVRNFVRLSLCELLEIS